MSIITDYLDKIMERSKKNAQEAKEIYDSMTDECKLEFWSAFCFTDKKGAIIQALKDLRAEYSSNEDEK